MDEINSTQFIVSVLTAIGIGGIVGAYFQSRFQHQKEVKEDIHQLKRKRYGAILIQMLTILDPERLSKTQAFRPDLTDIEDLKEEVRTEMLHSVLFASDEVIKAMARFNQDPNYSSYIDTVSAMRKDLWGKRTRLREEILRDFSRI